MPAWIVLAIDAHNGQQQFFCGDEDAAKGLCRLCLATGRWVKLYAWQSGAALATARHWQRTPNGEWQKLAVYSR